ncbi:putative rRNA intron-encoded homing endonuclease [Aphis craccivora]|uniref:Putative rRNA intron-encoded homing endonuclease n=1 Tax=Aphis craccivora TaxID=307492 RepID=A0A6G0W0Z0_APHCR|nr:putative rRNA intron-encoded homing endonuclease [Aphis craccivora]
MKRRRIASWHRLQLELGRNLIAFEPLTFVLDHTRTYLANAFASLRLETIQEFHL